jgi:hypothetical protein
MALFCRRSSAIWDFAIMCGIMLGIMCGHNFLSPSFVIISAKPPIRNALNSARLAFSNHTKPPPNNISTMPKTVVFQLRKMRSIIGCSLRLGSNAKGCIRTRSASQTNPLSDAPRPTSGHLRPNSKKWQLRLYYRVSLYCRVMLFVCCCVV